MNNFISRWQSENGIHNVSIEISFESEFQFTFTHLRFKTYRPAAMYIERSKNYGRTWEKYAYFSENCKRDFPSIPARLRNNMNEVLCTSEFSGIMPSEGGTVSKNIVKFYFIDFSYYKIIFRNYNLMKYNKLFNISIVLIIINL